MRRIGFIALLLPAALAAPAGAGRGRLAVTQLEWNNPERQALDHFYRSRSPTGPTANCNALTSCDAGAA